MAVPSPPSTHHGAEWLLLFIPAPSLPHAVWGEEPWATACRMKAHRESHSSDPAGTAGAPSARFIRQNPTWLLPLLSHFFPQIILPSASYPALRLQNVLLLPSVTSRRGGKDPTPAFISACSPPGCPPVLGPDPGLAEQHHGDAAVPRGLGWRLIAARQSHVQLSQQTFPHLPSTHTSSQRSPSPKPGPCPRQKLLQDKEPLGTGTLGRASCSQAAHGQGGGERGQQQPPTLGNDPRALTE